MQRSTCVPLREFFDATFAPLYLCGAAPRTFEAYNDTLRLWARLSSNPPLELISVETLARFKAALLSAGRSPGTVNKHLRHVHHLLTKAGPAGPRNRDALGILTSAPWCRPLKERKKAIKTVSDEAFSLFYRVCSPEWQALIVLSLTSLLRRGTLLSLRWDHVDLAAGLLRYEGTEDKAGEVRDKPLHSVAIAHLLRIRQPSGLLFAGITESTFCRKWRLLQSRHLPAELRFRLHDLKRSGCSRLAAAGTDLFTLRTLADHSSVQVTERYYVAASDGREAIDRFPLPVCLLPGGFSDGLSSSHA